MIRLEAMSRVADYCQWKAGKSYTILRVQPRRKYLSCRIPLLLLYAVLSLCYIKELWQEIGGGTRDDLNEKGS
jgi:hypothetical protein